MKEPNPERPEGGARSDITAGDIIVALWRGLREMRTVFQLLVIIAVATFLCAIIPQNGPAQMYHEKYGTFLGNIITRLGLDHINSAGWFIFLLGLLLLSLVACSRRLWVEAGARWRIPAANTAAGRARAKSDLTASVAGGADEALAQIQAAARRRGLRVQPLGDDGNRRLAYLHKNRTSAWGQAMAHYAVFLIALGSVLGSLPGISLDTNYDIREGETLPAQEAKLPFDVTVDGFRIERDPETDAVKNYFSKLRLTSGEQELAKAEISVNKPLKYRGYFISQSSWGLGAAKVEVTRGGKTESFAYPLDRLPSEMPGLEFMWGVPRDNGGHVIILGDGKSALVAMEFLPDARREGKEIMPVSMEYAGTPALHLALMGDMSSHRQQGGAPHALPDDLGWLLPGEKKTVGGTTVKFTGISQSTGLGIRKDLGWPLVWIGFVAVCLGMSLIFYLPLQRAVVAVEPAEKNKTSISIYPYRGEQTLGVSERHELWDDVLRDAASK